MADMDAVESAVAEAVVPQALDLVSLRLHPIKLAAHMQNGYER